MPPPMAERAPPMLPPSVDPRTGFCRDTKTFHSLRTPIPLPAESLPLTTATFTFSLLPSLLLAHPALVDSAIDAVVSYPDLLAWSKNLAMALRFHAGLFCGNVTFVLSPAGLNIPVLYFALLSIGTVVSPANPLGTPAEIAHQTCLPNPSVAFATAATAPNLPPHLSTILLDSLRFRSFLTLSKVSLL